LSKGYSLLELLIVLTITAILFGITGSIIQQHIAELTIERWCLQWIADAQLARSLSSQRISEVKLIALEQSWLSGWSITSNGRTLREFNPQDYKIYRLIELDPAMRQTQGFVDSLSGNLNPQLIFVGGEPAELRNGGFMASRLIIRHQTHPQIVRHIIMGSGGRLRLCNPASDRLGCQ
jgi:type IV fimbrial biogenesis protein FimT